MMKITFIIVLSVLHVSSASSVLVSDVDYGHGKVNLSSSSSSDVHVRRIVPIMFGRSLHMHDNLTECSESIDEFPPFFNEAQRRHGAVFLACIIAVYCFTLIAIICDSYFLPCVERICDFFHLSKDVAAATFMSLATSAPELFVNIIGTFVTESDIGIGTIVGSSMFNTLGVASIGSMAATHAIVLDWWPITRDTFFYITSIVLLVTVTWDSSIEWQEATVLVTAYVIYLLVMFQNDRISHFVKNSMIKLLRRKISEEPIKHAMELNTVSVIDVPPTKKYVEPQADKNTTENNNIKIDDAIEQDNDSIFKLPSTEHWLKVMLFIYSWPIKFLLYCTVPDCKKYSRVFPITFVMCVFWIGTNSYLVSWMITVIGSTIGIPDSVLGLTFLAAGGCLPEAISITITSRKGESGMGVSNALGANTMNILLSLGGPWFVKSLMLASEDPASSIKIVSGSLEYTILALIVVALTLYITIALNKFKLSKVCGIILFVFYIIFIILAILSELIFFKKQECKQAIR